MSLLSWIFLPPPTHWYSFRLLQSPHWSFLSHTANFALLLLLLSHFSCVRLCAIPQTAAHQAPPSLGFSRQEHWSGLPFPSPTHESEKWKWSRSVMSDSWQPHGLRPTRLLCPWDFPGRSTCDLLTYVSVYTSMLLSPRNSPWILKLCVRFFLLISLI